MSLILEINVVILVSLQHTEVPLLQWDAVDHDEVIQVVLGRCCCCCCRHPPSLWKQCGGGGWQDRDKRKK